MVMTTGASASHDRRSTRSMLNSRRAPACKGAVAEDGARPGAWIRGVCGSGEDPRVNERRRAAARTRGRERVGTEKFDGRFAFVAAYEKLAPCRSRRFRRGSCSTSSAGARLAGVRRLCDAARRHDGERAIRIRRLLRIPQVRSGASSCARCGEGWQGWIPALSSEKRP
jgi:hypothetical protein